MIRRVVSHSTATTNAHIVIVNISRLFLHVYPDALVDMLSSPIFSVFVSPARLGFANLIPPPITFY